MSKDKRRHIAAFFAQHRRQNGWTLEQVSQMTGISVPTLSKVEKRGQISFDTLLNLVDGLGLDFATVFDGKPAPPTDGGRLTVTRANEAQEFASEQYDYRMHAGGILGKQMIALIMRIKARSVDEFERMSSHEGEEFVIVLEGSVVMHSGFYAPMRLDKGDSVYFDSAMPHVFVAAEDEDATILSMCAGRGIRLLDEVGLDALPQGEDLFAAR